MINYILSAIRFCFFTFFLSHYFSQLNAKTSVKCENIKTENKRPKKNTSEACRFKRVRVFK